LIWHLANGACAHHDDHITILRKVFYRFWHGGNVLNEYWLDLTRDTDTTRERSSVCGDQGRFARGIHLSEQDCIRRTEYFDKILKAIPRACVTMWLKGKNDTTLRPCTTGGGQRSSHFNRVVTIVINDAKRAAFRGCKITNLSEASTNTTESRQAFRDCEIIYT
jgi:hypothetical protein